MKDLKTFIIITWITVICIFGMSIGNVVILDAILSEMRNHTAVGYQALNAAQTAGFSAFGYNSGLTEQVVTNCPIPDSCRIQYIVADTIIRYDTIYRQVVKPKPDLLPKGTTSISLRKDVNVVLLNDTIIMHTDKGDFIIYSYSRK